MNPLWTFDHPYYGPDDNTSTFESFAELKAAVDELDADMNHVYRWDWNDWSQPHHDSLFLHGEDRTHQEFTVFLVLPRKSMLINFTCPVTYDDEPSVREWLTGPRVAGALRAMWAPILDADAQ